MEYCTSVCCFRHNNVIKFEEKQWWGSCEGFIYPKIELNKLAHCFYDENLSICIKCGNCGTCERFDLINHHLNSCYLWTARKNAPYQPTHYNVLFF